MTKKLSFEKALERLDEIIELLSTGEAPLDTSLKLYAESAKLLAYCNESIKEAKLTIEEVFDLPKEEVEHEDEV